MAETATDLAGRIDALRLAGVSFLVCASALRGWKIDGKIIDGVSADDVVLSSGAEFARMQARGAARPGCHGRQSPGRWGRIRRGAVSGRCARCRFHAPFRSRATEGPAGQGQPAPVDGQREHCFGERRRRGLGLRPPPDVPRRVAFAQAVTDGLRLLGMPSGTRIGGRNAPPVTARGCVNRAMLRPIGHDRRPRS